jgi:4-diphosphocytidyl-2-C-methyl-D-erythritol kinase
MTTREAPAKLTLSLRVTGVREDGYHLIDAEMVALALADIVRIESSPTTELTVSGPFAVGIPTDESNLVHKALSRSNRTARIHIEKNIPHGGGLGGGSTDAAAVLRWAEHTDPVHAATLGADIPFSLIGGRAHVAGIGEKVTPLPFEQMDLTLFIPPVHVPTPLVYATWDAMSGPTGNNDNDLEPAALQAVPELRTWRELIATTYGIQPHLAGSGATWFARGHLTSAGKTPDGLMVVHTTTRPDAGRVVA